MMARLRHQRARRVDGVRSPLPFEVRAADGPVDSVRGRLLGGEVADAARLAVRVRVVSLPPPLALGP